MFFKKPRSHQDKNQQTAIIIVLDSHETFYYTLWGFICKLIFPIAPNQTKIIQSLRLFCCRNKIEKMKLIISKNHTENYQIDIIIFLMCAIPMISMAGNCQLKCSNFVEINFKKESHKSLHSSENPNPHQNVDFRGIAHIQWQIKKLLKTITITQCCCFFFIPLFRDNL